MWGDGTAALEQEAKRVPERDGGKAPLFVDSSEVPLNEKVRDATQHPRREKVRQQVVLL